MPEKRYRICKSKEELAELPESSTEVFKRNSLDRYMDRPNLTFKEGKYSVLDNFCFADFVAYYLLNTKPKVELENDNQPEVLLEDGIDTPCSYPHSIPLMSSKEKMRCRSVKLVVRYHTPNPATNAEAYAHHLLMMFYPFRKELELLSQPNKSYIDKLNEPDVISVVNSNKARFEPWVDLVNTALMNFRYGHHTDSFAEQENDDVEENVDNTKLCDDEGEEAAVVFDIETPAPHNSTPSRIDLMPDVNINDLIQSLNVKQRPIFEVVNKWARSHVKSLSSEQRTDIQPLHIFITGGAGCGKPHLIRTIHAFVSKTLSYRSACTEKTKVLLLAPTGVAAININGNTIHSGLGIPDECQGLVVPKLSDKKRCTLRMQLSDVKVVIIDEISMVSNKLLLYVHQRLLDIFGCSTNHKLFAGITVILVGDLYQLPQVLQKPVYAEFYDELYNIFPLWRNFQMCELTEVMRQRGDSILIDLLNNVRVGRLSLEDEVLLRSRFVKVTDPHYPTHALHIFA